MDIIDLKKLLGTPVEVQTSVGQLRLHPQRTKDFRAFAKLPEQATPLDRWRTYLPSVASPASADDEDDGTRIDDVFAKSLSDDDLERLADAYVKVSSAGIRSADGSATRGAGESAVTYLDRLLRANHAKQREGLDKISKDFATRYGPSVSAAIAALENQTASIRDTIAKFQVDDELLKRFTSPSIAEIAASKIPDDRFLPRFEDRADVFNSINDAAARRERERREELDITREMGRMMAQTASLLANLADTTTQFLRQFGESAEKSDKATRWSLHIAVWSVSISAILALVIAFFAGKSYFQDQRTIESTDKWQESVARSLKDNAAAEQERNRLLNERLLDLGNKQNAVQPETLKQPSAPTRPRTKPANSTKATP